jgi:hypothetical protein
VSLLGKGNPSRFLNQNGPCSDVGSQNDPFRSGGISERTVTRAPAIVTSRFVAGANGLLPGVRLFAPAAGSVHGDAGLGACAPEVRLEH